MEVDRLIIDRAMGAASCCVQSCNSACNSAPPRHAQSGTSFSRSFTLSSGGVALSGRAPDLAEVETDGSTLERACPFGANSCGRKRMIRPNSTSALVRRDARQHIWPSPLSQHTQPAWRSTGSTQKRSRTHGTHRNRLNPSGIPARSHDIPSVDQRSLRRSLPATRVAGRRQRCRPLCRSARSACSCASRQSARAAAGWSSRPLATTRRSKSAPRRRTDCRRQTRLVQPPQVAPSAKRPLLAAESDRTPRQSARTDLPALQFRGAFAPDRGVARLVLNTFVHPVELCTQAPHRFGFLVGTSTV